MEQLIATIKQLIKQNGNNEITGDILQGVLIAIVQAALQDGNFYGVATPQTTPSIVSDIPGYILASEAGTYPYFTDKNNNQLVVSENELALFVYDKTAWSKITLLTDIAQDSRVTEQLSRLEIALRANGSDLVYSSPKVTIAASSINRNNSVAVPIGAVAAGDKLSLSLGLIKITSGAPSGFSFALVDAAGNSIANGLTLQGQLTGTFTVHTAASAAQLVMYAGKSGATLGVGVEYDTVMLVRGDIPASALSLLGVLNRSKTYTDGIAAGKADLDPEGYVPSSQIAPLQGRQTGVQMGEGYFKSAAPALTFSGDRTLAAVFTTPSSYPAENQYIFTDALYRDGRSVYMIDRRLTASTGMNSDQLKYGEPNTFHMFVLSEREQVVTVYFDGVKVGDIIPKTYTAPTGLSLAAASNGTNIWTGIIHSFRLFDYALSDSEAAALWNGGAPQDFMLSPSGAMRTGVVAEYIPAGLLMNKWRDTSGNGLDLPYMPITAGGTAELDYQRQPISPSGSPLHDLFVAAGAVWDTASKSWAVTGYTGIDNLMMAKIYTQSNNVLIGLDWTCKLIYSTIPVNLPPLDSVTGYGDPITTAYATFSGSAVEKANVATNDNAPIGIIDSRSMFRACSKLKTVSGIILLNKAVNINRDMFVLCPLLERVRIKNLCVNMYFADSPLLSLESFQYLVENAGNTSAITVTVHADVYAKLTDPSNTEWYAVNAAAQAKQISFATA